MLLIICILFGNKSLYLVLLFSLSTNNSFSYFPYITWEQLPYLEVLESVLRTAAAESSVRTFLHGSKLLRLEVLRSGCKTADLGSSMVGFQ